MDYAICETHGGGYKRSCTKCELEAADKENATLRALADIAMQTKAQWDCQIAMAVARLGGEVEGAPTHAGNFLQRIDALRDIEEAAWRMANIWDRATMENDSREIAKAMGLANYLAMFDAWSAVEAALAPRSERREGEPAKSHTVCIGWTTIRRLAAEGMVYFEDVDVGLVAADDLFHASVPATRCEHTFRAEEASGTVECEKCGAPPAAPKEEAS